jgi:sigma-B regulation protein RsbU (phosphoserine phosphatase)
MSHNAEKTDGDDVSEAHSVQPHQHDYGFPGEPVAHMRIASRPDCLRLIRALVKEAGEGNSCGDECISQMVMAVDEACQNIIRHAYQGDPDGEIVVDIRRQGEMMAIYLLDFAAPVDVSTIKPRRLDEVKPGGLGTHFIQECMDESGFLTPPKGAGNCLRLVKKMT